MKYILAILILSVCFSAIKAQLRITECPNKRSLATIKSFSIDGCSGYPCILRRNTTAQLQIEMESRQRINNLKLKIAGIVQGKQVPFPAKDDNHCRMAVSGAKCPIARNTKFTYRNQMFVQPNYPQIQVVVVYEITDPRGNTVACIQWPAKIV